MMCLKVVLVILCPILLIGTIKIISMILQDLDSQREFHAFILRYNKTYARPFDSTAATHQHRHDDTEYYQRFRNFQDAMEHIKRLNGQREHSDAAMYGLSPFADMTRDEFLATMLTKRKILKVGRPKAVPFTTLLQHHARIARSANAAVAAGVRPLPDAFNWLDLGRVSPVRNQGQCGACWAHSVIETIESMAAIEHNATAAVRRLSVQQMIDCAGNNRGCSGGDTCNLLQWLVLNDVPIVAEQDYPQTGSQTPCPFNRLTPVAEPTRVRTFTCENLVGQEDRMMEYLATVGPITVGVNAVSWQYYLDGVIQHHCDGATLNHAVQIVGYDRRGDLPHFIVRNSWGDRFGDRGFVRIQMGRNMCGIAMQVSAVSVV